jgi:hypothetical protein
MLSLSLKNGGANVKPALTSRLVEGRVFHQRLQRKGHCFNNRLFWFVFCLADLPILGQHLPAWLLSGTHPALYRFAEADHLPNYHNQTTLLARLASIAQQHGQAWQPTAQGAWLLTHCRVAGYVFNPISVAVLAHPNGQWAGAIAEVGNTFGEQKPYWLPYQGDCRGQPVFAATYPKGFYVSPFGQVSEAFAFRVMGHPAQAGFHVGVQVGEATPEGRIVNTSLLAWQHVDTSHELATANLLRLTCRYPLVTLGVILAIHGQALLLLAKRFPLKLKHHDAQLQTEYVSLKPPQP